MKVLRFLHVCSSRINFVTVCLFGENEGDRPTFPWVELTFPIAGVIVDVPLGTDLLEELLEKGVKIIFTVGRFYDALEN